MMEYLVVFSSYVEPRCLVNLCGAVCVKLVCGINRKK